MLARPDISMTSGDVYRNDISVIRDNNYQNEQPQRELDEVETSKSRQFLKKAAKFLFSNVGLIVLIIVYAIAGAFLFVLLEQHQDTLNCQEAQGQFLVQVTKLKQNIVSYIQYNTTEIVLSQSQFVTLTYSTELDNTTVAYEKIADMLYAYRDFVLTTSSKYRYTGDGCADNKWTFINAIVFAMTVFTTIGYGNITPVTWEGQICCICYATVGIPIFLLCIANISGILGEMFRFLYGKICCGACLLIKRRQALALKAKLEEETGRDRNRGWALDDNHKSTHKGSDTIINEPYVGDEDPIHHPVSVPLTVTMLIIAFYIWAGSLMFHNFEQWTSIQAGYFCFITLATIGFGDFVPGTSADGTTSSINLAIGAIYILFGMAILAMCFDLMQEEIVAKFRWIGRKIGIIEKEEDPHVKPHDNTLNNDARPSTGSSVVDSNPKLNTNGKMIDDENENGWSTRSSSATARKQSPRYNIARVHPIAISSNEGTLHQRAGPTKNN